MPTECDDGSGIFIGIDVILDRHCRSSTDNNNKVTEAQSLVRGSTDPITVSSLLRVNNFGAWTVTTPVFDKPVADLECGALMLKGYGCQSDHDAWSANIQFNGQFDLLQLQNAKGTIRRTNPDGSYRQALGRIVSATVLTAQEPGTNSTGEITVQWDGGNEGDPGYPTFVPAP